MNQRQRSIYYRNSGQAWLGDYRVRVRRYFANPELLLATADRITPEQLRQEYGNTCHICGDPATEIDHFPTAVRDGGMHVLANVRPVCRAHNRPGGRTYAERLLEPQWMDPAWNPDMKRQSSKAADYVAAVFGEIREASACE